MQKPALNLGEATIGAKSTSTGLSVITCENDVFPGILKVGNVLKFNGLGNDVPSYARVTSTSTTNVSVTGISTVTGVV